MTGKDTPENISKPLGPNEIDIIEQTQKVARLEVLLRAPPDSSIYAVIPKLKLDPDYSPWTPRKASPAEEHEIKKVREIQEIILY